MRIRVLSAGLLTFAVLSACSTDPTSASAGRPAQALLDPAVTVTALTRDVALAAPISTSGTFSKAGGELKLDAVGLQVSIPAGALTTKTKITVTALAGDVVAYEFEPHGLVFARPITVKQDTKGTSWYKVTDASTVEAGYFADASLINQLLDEVSVTELLPTQLDLGNAKVIFDVSHFSGYMLSTGRKGSQ